MTWSLTPVIYIYIQTALITAAVAFFAWRRRATPGASSLAGVLAAATLWASMVAAESAAPTLAAKVLAAKISHIAIQTLPVFLLTFVLRYTANTAKKLRRRLYWLWIIPALAVLAAFTNERHFLFWRRVELMATPFGLQPVYEHGPLFWAATAYLYILLLTATALLLSTLLLNQGVFRRQALVLLAATAAPWLANALYLSGVNPIPGFDWTPLAFIITGLLLALAIFRTGLLELQPVACKVLFEQMRDPLFVIDAQQRIIDANPAARAFWGAGRVVAGRLTTEVLSPELYQVLTAQDGESMTIHDPNGNVHQFDVSVSPLIGVHPMLDGNLILLRDTTDRMMLEETLRQSEQRYRQLIDDAPFPTLVSSMVDGAVLYANRQARVLLSLESAADGVFHVDDFFSMKDACTELLTLIRQQAAVSDFEVQLQDCTGRPFAALISATSILFTNENAMLACINDITLRKAAEQALVEAKVAAETTTRAKNEFLATMSHELRTPLFSMIGLTEALLGESYGPLTDLQKHSLETIVQSGRQLSTLVNEVLELSRLEAGAVTLNPEPTSIHELCQGVLDTLQDERPAPAPPIEYAIASADLQLEVDPRRLREILLHLLRNAVKFTPPEGRIGLTVTSSPAQHIAQFIVWDEGIGIEPEAIDRLFRPFAQLDAGLTRRYGGLGIGLAIVQHLVALHGGSIHVESALEAGSRFVVSLPITSGKDK